jgi:hypothetical protein
LAEFQKKNLSWIHIFFPHIVVSDYSAATQSRPQRFFEYILSGSLGEWLDRTVKRIQWRRIRIDDQEVIVKADELSFHPDTKEVDLIETFLSRAVIDTPKVVSVDIVN